MNDFLYTAWHLRYTLAVVALLAWIGIRLAEKANDAAIERHVTAALEPDEDADAAWAELPIYGATAAYLARVAAEDIDRDWAEMNGGIA